MKLTDLQVSEVRNVFIAKGVKNSLNDEILDHCCSVIENKIKDGQTFEEAVQSVLRQDYIDSLKKMNKKLKIIQFSKFIHLKIIILGLLLISALTFYHFSKKGPNPSSVIETSVLDLSYPIEKNNCIIYPPEIWPLSLPGKVSSGFGMRMHPIFKEKKFHFGIDIPAAQGTPVLATSDGEIVETGYTVNYGNYIVIKHDETYSSKYSQLHEIHVNIGDKVNKGIQIGSVGSSGRSTAPHLHFEIIESGKHVDPMKFIKA